MIDVPPTRGVLHVSLANCDLKLRGAPVNACAAQFWMMVEQLASQFQVTRVRCQYVWVGHAGLPSAYTFSFSWLSVQSSHPPALIPSKMILFRALGSTWTRGLSCQSPISSAIAAVAVIGGVLIFLV